jgi:ketosteroid isomerase-like protein
MKRLHFYSIALLFLTSNQSFSQNETQTDSVSLRDDLIKINTLSGTLNNDKLSFLKNDQKKWIKEISDTELEFSKTASKEGITKAFLAYAADEAVLMRNNSLIIGIKAIEENLNNQSSITENATLTWKPDFVDVSSSGDLGYTYGKYTYTTKDSLGNLKVKKGIFHTVWKRQADGNWKFVWD